MQWRGQDTDDTRVLHAFVYSFLVGRGGGGEGWGQASLVNFGILEVATQIVRETIF